MKDTARVLGRMFDGIEYRGCGQTTSRRSAEYAGVPVWNGLTDECHPTQILADMLTMTEHSDKPYDEIAYGYLGDARNNMGNSLLVVGGASSAWTSGSRGPRDAVARRTTSSKIAASIATETGARLTLTEDVDEGVAGRRLPLHRRVGLDGRGEERLGRADQAAHAVPGERGRDRARPATRT